MDSMKMLIERNGKIIGNINISKELNLLSKLLDEIARTSKSELSEIFCRSYEHLCRECEKIIAKELCQNHSKINVMGFKLGNRIEIE